MATEKLRQEHSRELDDKEVELEEMRGSSQKKVCNSKNLTFSSTGNLLVNTHCVRSMVFLVFISADICFVVTSFGGAGGRGTRRAAGCSEREERLRVEVEEHERYDAHSR